mmetsp:Transcript_8428/g.28177  ORF Transcript_8428/g.28177 Transcript_8428/m.28177 type:complete len:252 (-) Transcript_8428:3000-3755(-)
MSQRPRSAAAAARCPRRCACARLSAPTSQNPKARERSPLTLVIYPTRANLRSDSNPSRPRHGARRRAVRRSSSTRASRRLGRGSPTEYPPGRSRKQAAPGQTAVCGDSPLLRHPTKTSPPTLPARDRTSSRLRHPCPTATFGRPSPRPDRRNARRVPTRDARIVFGRARRHPPRLPAPPRFRRDCGSARGGRLAEACAKAQIHVRIRIRFRVFRVFPRSAPPARTNTAAARSRRESCRSCPRRTRRRPRRS